MQNVFLHQLWFRPSISQFQRLNDMKHTVLLSTQNIIIVKRVQAQMLPFYFWKKNSRWILTNFSLSVYWTSINNCSCFFNNLWFNSSDRRKAPRKLANNCKLQYVNLPAHTWKINELAIFHHNLNTRRIWSIAQHSLTYFNCYPQWVTSITSIH